MKLSVKELQAVDAVFNFCSKESKFRMVINYQGKLVTGDFLQYVDREIVEPKVFYNGEIRYLQEDSSEYFFHFVAKKVLKAYNSSQRIHTSSENPELFFELIVKTIEDLTKNNPINQFKNYTRYLMYNVKFLESDTELKYIYLDPSVCYEVVSII